MNVRIGKLLYFEYSNKQKKFEQNEDVCIKSCVESLNEIARKTNMAFFLSRKCIE